MTTVGLIDTYNDEYIQLNVVLDKNSMQSLWNTNLKDPCTNVEVQTSGVQYLNMRAGL